MWEHKVDNNKTSPINQNQKQPCRNTVMTTKKKNTRKENINSAREATPLHY
jgi:hypothetical protein